MVMAHVGCHVWFLNKLVRIRSPLSVRSQFFCREYSYVLWSDGVCEAVIVCLGDSRLV